MYVTLKGESPSLKSWGHLVCRKEGKAQEKGEKTQLSPKPNCYHSDLDTAGPERNFPPTNFSDIGKWKIRMELKLKQQREGSLSQLDLHQHWARPSLMRNTVHQCTALIIWFHLDELTPAASREAVYLCLIVNWKTTNVKLAERTTKWSMATLLSMFSDHDSGAFREFSRWSQNSHSSDSKSCGIKRASPRLKNLFALSSNNPLTLEQLISSQRSGCCQHQMMWMVAILQRYLLSSRGMGSVSLA